MSSKLWNPEESKTIAVSQKAAAELVVQAVTNLLTQGQKFGHIEIDVDPRRVLVIDVRLVTSAERDELRKQIMACVEEAQQQARALKEDRERQGQAVEEARPKL